MYPLCIEKKKKNIHTTRAPQSSLRVVRPSFVVLPHPRNLRTRVSDRVPRTLPRARCTPLPPLLLPNTKRPHLARCIGPFASCDICVRVSVALRTRINSLARRFGGRGLDTQRTYARLLHTLWRLPDRRNPIFCVVQKIRVGKPLLKTKFYKYSGLKHSVFINQNIPIFHNHIGAIGGIALLLLSNARSDPHPKPHNSMEIRPSTPARTDLFVLSAPPPPCTYASRKKRTPPVIQGAKKDRHPPSRTSRTIRTCRTLRTLPVG